MSGFSLGFGGWGKALAQGLNMFRRPRLKKGELSDVDGPWTILVFGVPPEERGHVDRAFPEIQKRFVPRKADLAMVERELQETGHNSVISWGRSFPKSLAALQQVRPSLKVTYLYRGPFSIYDEEMYRSYVWDLTGLYVNPRRPCDFEIYANTFPFQSCAAFVEASEALRIRHFGNFKAEDHVGVILQDRTDQAFAFGQAVDLSHQNLITKAASEHPEADIVIAFNMSQDSETASIQALETSLPAEIAARLRFVTSEDTAIDQLCRARQVYTVNAPLAVAPLLAGRKVTTFSSAFYAGWGLTRDNGTTLRRSRHLTMPELATLIFGLYFRWTAPGGRILFPGLSEET